MGPARPTKMSHVNGTTTVSPTEVLVARGISQYLVVTNLDTQNDVDISFNKGKNFYPISPGETFSVGALFHSIFVRANFSDSSSAVTDADLATAAALPAYTQAGAGAGATLTADAIGVLTVDGVATVLGDRLLVKDGAAGPNNGVYEVTTEGTAAVAFILTRATDHDTDAEVTSGDFVVIIGGTANSGITFQISTTDPITVDTTAITWTELNAAYSILMGSG